MDENKGPNMHDHNWLNLPNSSLDPPGRQLDLSSPTPNGGLKRQGSIHAYSGNFHTKIRNRMNDQTLVFLKAWFQRQKR